MTCCERLLLAVLAGNVIALGNLMDGKSVIAGYINTPGPRCEVCERVIKNLLPELAKHMQPKERADKGMKVLRRISERLLLGEVPGLKYD
ncbi:MAG: hypothetical protein V3W44_11020 [Dehalococcoidales bacterium]